MDAVRSCSCGVLGSEVISFSSKFKTAMRGAAFPMLLDSSMMDRMIPVDLSRFMVFLSKGVNRYYVRFLFNLIKS